MKKILFALSLSGFAITAIAQLTVYSNATFTIQPGATVRVKGNIISNEDIQGTGLLVLNGTSLQNVDMGGKTIPNLELDNAANVTLINTNTRIGNSLVFTNGKFQTENFNLVLSPMATITGANNSSFVWTNGTGQLKKELTADIASYELPVGENGNYRPAYLTTAGNSYTSADFGVRVLGSADPNKPPMTESYLNTYWQTTKAGITGGTVTMAGRYTDLDVTGTETNLVGYYNNGTDWSSADETHNTSTNIVSALVTTDNGTLSGINKFLLVGARAFLQGAYNSTTGLMTDNLRTLPFGSPASTANFPSTDPYRVAPYSTTFTHVNNAATETIASAAVLDQTGTNDDITDWVFVELRNTASSPNAILQTRSALVQRDGDIVDVDGTSPVTFNNLANGNYVLAVRHRNHLGLRTDEVAFPKAINESKSTAFTTNVIDFRTATDAQLYGNSAAFKTAAHPTLGSVNLLWGGNANGHTTAGANSVKTVAPNNTNDYYFLFNTTLSGDLLTIFSNVYHPADVNMDRLVKMTAPNNTSDYYFLFNTVLGGDVLNIILQQLL